MRHLFQELPSTAKASTAPGLCSQFFVITLLTQIDRVGLLHIIDCYRRQLQESEGFVTATIITPKQRSSWTAERTWHETYFSQTDTSADLYETSSFVFLIRD